MKNLNLIEMNAAFMHKILGGTVYSTLDVNGCNDMWHDNDESKTMSPGDVIVHE